MVGAVSCRAGVGDGEFVGFVFAELLHGLAAVVSVDLQRWRCARVRAKGDSSLAGELRLESLDLAVEGDVVRASNRNGKRSLDWQLACARLHAGGHGHQVELGLGLSSGKRRQKKKYASKE